MDSKKKKTLTSVAQSKQMMGRRYSILRFCPVVSHVQIKYHTNAEFTRDAEINPLITTKSAKFCPYCMEVFLFWTAACTGGDPAVVGSERVSCLCHPLLT
jgi:hypothetical protein